MQYYIGVGDERRGPFERDQLLDQGVRSETLVWRQGLSDWVRASDLAEIKDVLDSMPSPGRSGGRSSRSENRPWWQSRIVLVVAGLLFLALADLIIIKMNNSQDIKRIQARNKYSQKSVPQKASPANAVAAPAGSPETLVGNSVAEQAHAAPGAGSRQQATANGNDPVISDVFLEKLQRPAELECIEMKLVDVVADLNKSFSILLLLDASLPNGAGEELVTIKLNGVTRRSLLSHVLDCVGLDYFVPGNAVVIVTRDTAHQRWSATSPAFRLKVRYEKGPAALESGKAIWEALQSPTRCDLKDVALTDLLDYLSTYHSIRILLDYRALEQAGITADSPVTFSVDGKPLGKSLAALLAELNLEMTIDNEVLLVSTKSGLVPKLQVYGDYVEITTEIDLQKVRRLRVEDPTAATAFLQEVEAGVASNAEILPAIKQKLLASIDACKRERK